MTLTDRDPELVLLKIDLEEADSPVARQYEIDRVPYFMVFGPDGKLRCRGQEAHLWLDEAMRKAKNLSPGKQ